MDAERFDRIAKTFAARASRRRLMGGLAVLGAGSGVLGPRRAGARRAAGGADGSGVTSEGTDRVCKGHRAASNTRCSAKECAPGCFCAESVSGHKKCVDFTTFSCPPVDECDRTRDCAPGLVCIKVGGCCDSSRNNVCLPSCV